MRRAQLLLAATATVAIAAQAHADTDLGATVGGAAFRNKGNETGTTEATDSLGVIVALRGSLTLGRHVALVGEVCVHLGPTWMLTYGPLLEIRVNRFWLRGGLGFGHAEGELGAEGGYGGLAAGGATIKRWGPHSVGVELRVSSFVGEAVFGDVGLGATWRYP